MHIIPAIDIIDGKCVRLTRGDYNQKKIYNEDPLEVARQFEDHGLTRLHLVDLDGAREKHVVNHKVLDRIAGKTKLHIDFGGGIQSDEDLKIAFEYGAKQITGGSIAVKDRALFLSWLKSYGAERIILGADVNNNKITISGWQEDSALEIERFLEDYMDQGIKYVISTDVSKDGALQGPSYDLYHRITDQFPDIALIASGGVSGLADLERLNELPLFGVIVGKAIYEGRIKLKDLSTFVA